MSAQACSDDLYDVAVVGVGAMGVSIAHHLARAGQRVLGLERFSIAHSHGSSHGETRITRLAYWEHPNYVPLLRRSFDLVSELERESGERLFLRTGSLDIGPETEATFQGSLLSCLEHGLEHDVLTPAQLSARFPAWSIPAHYRALYQPGGGMLFPEKLVAATASLARKHGAVLMEGMEVVDVVPTGFGVEVHARRADSAAASAAGAAASSPAIRVFRARKVVLCAGAWLPSLLARSSLGLSSPRLRTLAGLLVPERQVVTWYASSEAARADQRFEPGQFPVWISTLEGAHYYGFPLLEGGTPGLKIGRYHHKYEQLSEAQMNDLEGRARTDPSDRDYTDDFMSVMLRGVSASPSTPVLASQSCVFTNSPDEHFVLDRCPDRATLPQVSFVSACSGHGFKFSPAIGEAVAEMVMRGDDAPPGPREQLIRWLDAGRLLGDRPPMQTLDPHMRMQERVEKEKRQPAPALTAKL